jgi:hypothetical protein
MQRFLAYLERCGIEFDTAVNVVTGGKLGQTVSLRVAEAQRAEKKRGVFGWGCWFCDCLVTEQGRVCVTRGKLVQIEWAWWDACADEVYGLHSPDWKP